MLRLFIEQPLALPGSAKKYTANTVKTANLVETANTASTATIANAGQKCMIPLFQIYFRIFFFFKIFFKI